MIYLKEGNINLHGKKLLILGRIAHKPHGTEDEWKPYEGQFDIGSLSELYSVLGLLLLGKKIEGNGDKPLWRLYQGKSMIGLYQPRGEEVRKRILKLCKIELTTKQIAQLLGMSPRTVRYYLKDAHPRKLSLRRKANLQDLIWIERLSQAGAGIEGISDILRLSGKVIFKLLMDQKPQGSTSDQPESQMSHSQTPL